MSNFVKPCIGRITSPFGWRIHPIHKNRSWHQGVDIAYPGVVNIRASADGTVIRVGELGTYGNVVMIRHSINGVHYETNYAHLRDGAKVKVGQRVKQGDIIAHMGNTGSSTAQHLHFEIHKGKWATSQPNAVNPELYMGEEFVKLGEEKPVEPVITPVAKPKEEDELIKKAIVIGSFIDYPVAEVLSVRLDAPIYPRNALKGKVAEELIVVGGDKKGLAEFANKVTDLSGNTRFATSRNVEKYLG